MNHVVKITLPDKGTMLSFKNYNHSLRVQLVIYADFDCFTEIIPPQEPEEDKSDEPEEDKLDESEEDKSDKPEEPEEDKSYEPEENKSDEPEEDKSYTHKYQKHNKPAEY